MLSLDMPSTAPQSPVALGADSVDARLGGGLACGDLHEIYAAADGDGSAATAFALLIARRAQATTMGNTIWVREDKGARRAGALYGSGLVELGFDPDALVLVEAPDTLSALRAAADAVKCTEIATVIIELWGKVPMLDLTASRRLAMAAGLSGVLTLMLRIDAEPMPSVARTRWRVAAAPSSPLATNVPGHPAFDIALLRHRSGLSGFETRLEWNRDQACFAPLSGGLPAVAALGTDPPRKAA